MIQFGFLPHGLLATALGLPVQQATPSARPSLPDAIARAAEEHYRAAVTARADTNSADDSRIARLLEGSKLRFDAFESEPDGDLALGFSYEVMKTLITADDDASATLDFVASGNVAFQRERNPDDFLSTTFRARWSGTKWLGGEDETRAIDDVRVPSNDELAALDAPRTAALSAKAATAADEDGLRAEPEFDPLAREYARHLESELPPEFLWDFTLHAGVESTQDFGRRQRVFGSSLGGRLVSWDSSSSLSRFNVFDLPAATLRWLAGEDEDFELSGTAYPTVSAGFDIVDAGDDDGRLSVTDDKTFLRARFEAAWRSHAFTIAGERLALSAAWRADQEIDAPAPVKRVNVDGSRHLRVELELPRGWSLAYATGRLPLDGENDSTFSLGYSIQF